MRRAGPASWACTCEQASVLRPSADLSEDVDAVAGAQGHDGALDAAPGAVPESGALALALPVERVDVEHLDVEHLLDRDLDLGLVGQRVDVERVLVVVQQAVALLRDHRSEQHVARIVEHQASLPSSVAASAASVASLLLSCATSASPSGSAGSAAFSA